MVCRLLTRQLLKYCLGLKWLSVAEEEEVYSLGILPFISTWFWVVIQSVASKEQGFEFMACRKAQPCFCRESACRAFPFMLGGEWQGTDRTLQKQMTLIEKLTQKCWL